MQHVTSLKTGPYYTISPASLWFTKQYPINKWVEFIKSVPENSLVYLLGAANDHSLCEEIIEQAACTFIRNLSGQLTFLQSAALMQDARMNFTNDSAPMHLASSVNAPVTAVYCSTIPGFGFGPLSDNAAVVEVENELSCRPCGLHGKRSCPETHFKCARDIRNRQLTERL